MMIVLQVLAGVVLAVVLVLLVGRWWFKRWMRRHVGQAMAAAACVDPRYARPARIQLVAADPNTAGDEALRRAWADWHALGFRSLGDFETRYADEGLLRAASLDDRALGLALRGAADDPAEGRMRFVVFALVDGSRLLALSNDADDAPMESAGIRWLVDAAATPASALARLSAEVAGRVPRTIDSALFCAIYERAWAARVDSMLVAPPSRAAFDAHLASLPQPVAHEIAERAYQLTLTQWNAQVTEAALDQFRRASRIDAVRWESLRDDVHVVHRHTDDASVRGWLIDTDLDRMLADQLMQQGKHGLALYEAMIARLPPGRARSRLGEVTRPLRAVLYGPADAAASAASGAQDHAYEAEDASGRKVQGAVIARSSADAKQQLEAMGLKRPRVLFEPMPVGAPEPFMLEPSFLAAKARAIQRGIGASLLFSLAGSVWLWLPPLLWVGWSLRQGPPFGWGDWIGFVVAGIAVLAVLVLVLPMLLFHELQRARLYARWGQARACLAVLRRVNLMRGINQDQLLAEELKIQAGSGDLAHALARWTEREPHLPRDQYLLVLSTIHDAAGDHAGMIDAQRALRAASPAPDMPTVDLALSLARYGGPAGVDEAEALLAEVRVQDLSELVTGGHSFARGLIAAARGQHAAASHHYQAAQRQFAQFRNNPLMHGLLSEVGGYHALALREAGDTAGAAALWASVLPVLRAQPGPHPLLRAWGETPV